VPRVRGARGGWWGIAAFTTPVRIRVGDSRSAGKMARSNQSLEVAC